MRVSIMLVWNKMDRTLQWGRPHIWTKSVRTRLLKAVRSRIGKEADLFCQYCEDLDIVKHTLFYCH